eukprot:g8506.t1
MDVGATAQSRYPLDDGDLAPTGPSSAAAQHQARLRSLAAPRVDSERRLPRFVRLALRYSLTRSTTSKGIFLLNAHLWDLWGLAVFAAVFRRALPLGIFLGLFGHINTCSIAAMDVNRGPLYNMLGDPKVAAKVNGALRSSIFVSPVVILLMNSLVYPLILIPMATNEMEVFGALADRYIGWIVIYAHPLNMIIGLPMQLMVDALKTETYGIWQLKQREYIKFVRDELLAFVDGCKNLPAGADTNGVRVAETLARIGAAQQMVEDWARSINDAMAVFQGIQILTLTVIPCMMIAAISFLTLDTAMVVVSLVLSIFMYGFFFETLRAIAQPNLTWHRACREMLTNAQLKPAIRACFGEHPDAFERFLNAHDLSAARVFGLQVTTKRLTEVVGLIGSALALAVYLIARQEIERLA